MNTSYILKTFIILFLFFTQILLAQTSNISGQLNSFARVTAITSNTLTIDNVSLAPSVTLTSAFGANQKILIIQMKGASISTANDNTFGTLTNINSAGNYEMISIDAISGTGPTYTITTKANFSRTYNTNGSVQIISVPRFVNANVNGDITTINWDASLGRGGVITFEVQGTLRIGASILANGVGFVGGSPNATGGGGALNSLIYRDGATSSTSCGTQYNAAKGEGVADYAFNGITGLNFGRGAMLTGGGGANEHNGGGGGGSNFSTGGNGGEGWPGAGSCSGGTATGAGIGGNTMTYTPAANKIFMGGGAGGGQQNNNVATAGTNGGGIIVVRAGTLTVNTSSPTTRGFYANGANNVNTGGNDGGGGGGAGGTIFLDVLTYNLTGILNISANGGNGSNVNDGSTHGGGGGGGIGPILLRNAVPASQSANANFVSVPGTGGLNCTSCSRAPNGSNSPTGSSVLTGFSVPGDVVALPIRLLSFNAFFEEDKVKIEWITATEQNVKHFEIERANNTFQQITKIAQINAVGNSNNIQSYTTKDENPLFGLSYYRLKSVDIDGSVQYSDWKAVKKEIDIRIYPNPTTDFLVIETSKSNEKMKVYFYDLKGSVILEKEIDKTFTFDVTNLPKGLYVIKVISATNVINQKIIIQ